MVDVAVGVDHRRHGTDTEVLVHQGHRRLRGLHRGQGIDDDAPPFARHHGQVGQVEAPHLVEAGRNLEEARFGVEPSLAPQAGVDLGRAASVEEGVVPQVPHVPTAGVGDVRRLGSGDATPGGPLLVGVGFRRVEEGQRGRRLVGRSGVGAGGLGGHVGGEAGSCDGGVRRVEPCRVGGAVHGRSLAARRRGSRRATSTPSSAPTG